ncbi:hypothetical protein EJ05DRAFT_509736, partial [Pseudovirgaria hyperparasitica]
MAGYSVRKVLRCLAVLQTVSIPTIKPSIKHQKDTSGPSFAELRLCPTPQRHSHSLQTPYKIHPDIRNTAHHHYIHSHPPHPSYSSHGHVTQPLMPPPPPAYRRNGKLQACEPCRKAKLRCDHAVPACARCTRRNRADLCVYHPAPLTRPKSKPKSASTLPHVRSSRVAWMSSLGGGWRGSGGMRRGCRGFRC